jgi:hypothetical protein
MALVMTTLTTPKTAAFRSRLAKAEALHTEICTLDTAIRDRDATRTRMADCCEEAEARKHLGDLMRAEETVTIKQVRDPRLQADLADLLTQTEAAHAESHAEVAAIARCAPKDALAEDKRMVAACAAFRKVLRRRLNQPPPWTRTPALKRSARRCNASP